MSRIPQPRPEKNAAAGREDIETSGEAFPDGTMLELIRDEAGATSLLRWDGNSATISKSFEVNGKVYRPLQLHPTIVRALRLPRHITPYGSTRDLFNDLCKVLTDYTDVAEQDASLMAYSILGSCLVDRLLVAPFVSIVAPVGAPRAQLLRLVSSLCRRPLIVAEATPAALSSLSSMRPTFLFDEPNLSRRAERLLYATNSSGRFVFRNERMMGVFSAKVICSREPLRDPSLASQALQVTLSASGRQVPFLEDFVSEQIADEFQPKLLQYRLTKFSTVRTPPIDVSELTAPMQDLARALATCVADDEELQLGVVQLLRERDQEVRVDPSTELGSVVLEGLLFCCHTRGRSQVLCGELADIVNTMWTKRGEGRQTTPESVGWKLRALQLRTEAIDGAGKGLRLTEAARARIHSLARVYRVPSLQQVVQEECAHCQSAFGNR